MKLSPIWLFLILLIVLIISAIFVKPTKESFVSFYGSTDANTTNLTIPNYPNHVNKLYDNDFFDPKNGNILRVYACEFDSKTGQDTTGAGIDYIDVIDRSANSTKFENGQPITTSSLKTVPNSYHTWAAYSTDENFSHITSNQLIYSAWGQDTYIHILDLNHNLNACGFLYGPNMSSPIYTDFNTSLTKLSAKGNRKSKGGKNHHNATKSNKGSSHTVEGEYIFDANRNMTLYEFNEHVLYAPLTGDLILVDKSGEDLIFNRSGSKISSFSENKGISSSTTPWVQYDLVGNHMIIYSPNKTNTTIILLQLNSDNLTYNIVSVGRFLADGSLQKDANTNIVIPSDALNGSKNIKKAVSTPTAASNITADSNFYMAQMNDYLLKTQIIPPICPTCPQCPSIGTCTNCGSTPSATTKPVTPSAAFSYSPVGSPAAHDDKHEFSSLLRDTGSGTKDLLKDTASGTVGLAKDAVGGTVGLAKEAVGGTVGLAKEAVGGTVGLAKEAVGGAVGLLKSTGEGAAGLLRDTGEGTTGLIRDTGRGISNMGGGGAGRGPEQGGSTYSGASGSGSSTGYYAQGVGPQNPFTYNGALTEKPTSNFIPLTADFSKFGR
jgi:hypothetical protein